MHSIRRPSSDFRLLLNELRERLYDPPSLTAPQWLELTKRLEYVDAALATYAVEHSPYKSLESLRISAKRARRRTARSSIERLVSIDPARPKGWRSKAPCRNFRPPQSGCQEAILRALAAWRIGLEAGIVLELATTNAAWTLYPAQRLEAAALFVGHRRRSGMWRPLGDFTGCWRRWIPEPIERGPCCEDVFFNYQDFDGVFLHCLSSLGHVPSLFGFGHNPELVVEALHFLELLDPSFLATDEPDRAVIALRSEFRSELQQHRHGKKPLAHFSVDVLGRLARRP